MDINTIAYRVVQQAIGAVPKKSVKRAKAGKLGGIARAKSVSKQKRRQIALNANRKRWEQRENQYERP